jgi:uncharacterized protein
MLTRGAAKKVTIYLNEDTHGPHGPLHNSVVEFLMHKSVAGATLIRPYSGFGSRHQFHKPLHEAIVERCRALKMAGATVLRGVEGYGETAAIHRQHLMKHDLPITVVVVDSAEQIQALEMAVTEMLDKGVMTLSDVRMRRVQRGLRGGIQ